MSQVTQLACSPPPSYSFTSVHLASAPQVGGGGDTHAECINRWEGGTECGEEEVESPKWGKVVE
jgi:hypothetical protein